MGVLICTSTVKRINLFIVKPLCDERVSAVFYFLQSSKSSSLCVVSLTGSWRVPVFVFVVILLILGSQEKAPVAGNGKQRHREHFHSMVIFVLRNHVLLF